MYYGNLLYVMFMLICVALTTDLCSFVIDKLYVILLAGVTKVA